MSPGKINKCFDKFYQDLYKSKCSVTPESLNEFLAKLQLPALDAGAVRALEAEITHAKPLSQTGLILNSINHTCQKSAPYFYGKETSKLPNTSTRQTQLLYWRKRL